MREDTYVVPFRYQKRQVCFQHCRHRFALLPVIILAVLFILPGIASADGFVGGIPLTTVQTGTVTGDLYIDATPPVWANQYTSNISKTFTLPENAVGNITWARLYISAYCGHMQDDKNFHIINRWDGNGDGIYEQVWNEAVHAPFSYVTNATTYELEGNDNTALGGGAHDRFRMINDHENRVTSDYFMWYNVTDMIKSRTVKVNIDTYGSYDGRTKVATLVVAYNDSSSATLTRYWVNQGHDPCTYYPETQGDADEWAKHIAVGTTSFSTADLGSSFTSATLIVNHMASHNGDYAFPGTGYDSCKTNKIKGDCNTNPWIQFDNPLPSGTNIQGSYSGVTTWDVTDQLKGYVGENAVLSYSRDLSITGGQDLGDNGYGGFYKLPLAFLVVKNPLPPSANFTANVVKGTAPLAVQFTDTSTASPSSWNWDFGDGDRTNVSVQDPLHTYTSAGAYTVKLTATNSGGSNTITRTGFITVATGPTAPVVDFTAVPVNGTAPLTVIFTDRSTGNVSAWAWDFGDGDNTNATVQSPVHTYAAGGTFTVNLTVTGPGGTNSSARAGYVTVSPAASVTPTAIPTTSPPSDTPVLSLSPHTQSFGVGESRTFQIVMDQAPQGLAGYDLVVSLGNASVGEITQVDYPSWRSQPTNLGSPVFPCSSVLLGSLDNGKQIEAGAIGIVLANITVKGIGDGRTPMTLSAVHMDADLGANITPVIESGAILIGSYSDPVASFTANVTSGRVPLAVQFTDMSTGTPTAWFWDFSGDGLINSIQRNPVVTYTTPGTYPVSLTVTTDAGEADTIAIPGYITVNDGVNSSLKAPVAGFTNSTPLTGTVPLTVYFLDQSENTPTSWSWDFGDGGTSSEKNPSHTYQSANTYTVTLTATNAAGANTTIRTGYVTVIDAAVGAPVASFTPSTASGTAPLIVTFTDTSTGTITNRLWNFGDGNTSRLSTPTNTFSSPGIYPVTLTVANSHGSNTATQTITVNTVSGKPGVAFSASPLSGAYPLAVQFTDQSSGSPYSWSWSFGDGSTSSTQNPTHTYSASGTYSVTLTATNSAGSDSLTKSSYISVTQSSTAPDLSISNIVPNLGGTSGGTVFALKDNKITINILNTGTASSTQTQVKLSAADWTAGSTATVPVIAAGGSTIVSITDPTVRSSQGSTVTYTAIVDPEKTLGELSETNNTMTSTFPVLFDGYAGKKYWTAGADRGTDTDVVTKHTYDLHGGVTYSRGDSVYRSGSFSKDSSVKGWLSYDVLWTTSDMNGVPSDATIKAAYLYVPYTWDNEKIVDNGHTSLTFNGNSVSQSALYTDKSNFGTWADYEYGLLTYDVTSSYKQDEENTATFTRSNPKYSDPSEAGYYTKLSMYEFYLVVVYEDSSKTRKQIFINDGFDLLGASDQYGTSEQEATAYIPFTGMDIDKTNMQKATLYTFVPAGDSHEGNLLYNGNVIASNVWDWGGSGTGADGVPQVAVDTRDVTSYIQSSGNTFGIQSTLYNGNGQSTGTSCMAAAQQILIVDMGTTSGIPSVDFYGSPTSGTVSLSVAFTDSSTNSPTSWYWYFGDGGTSTSQNPTHPYTTAGTYTVSLTAKNAKGSASATKTDYIVVRSSSSSTTGSSTSTSSTTHIENSEGGSGSSGSGGGQSGDSGNSGDGSSGSNAGTSSGGRSQSGPLEKSGSSGSSSSGGEEGTGPEFPSWLTELVLGALVVIGAGGTVAHVKGYSLGMIAGTLATGAATWQKGFKPFLGSRGSIYWDGPEHPSRTIDSGTGLVRSGEGSRFSIPRWWPAAAIIAIVLIAIAVVAGLGLLGGIALPFGDAGSNGSFDVIPTVENIRDLDTTNHVSDYPVGFSAHNGILFVYNGDGKIPLDALEVDLKKGTTEIDLTAETVPPSKNAVNSRLSSYFEEEGNGDGTLDPGEWLMVYADNCYDSTQANDMPRGKILTWQPAGAATKIEVPLGDMIDYRIKNSVTGTTLQEGTLNFVPSSS